MVDKITAKIEIYDLYANGILDLGQFFKRLDKEAGIDNIRKLKVAPSEKILENISR